MFDKKKMIQWSRKKRSPEDEGLKEPGKFRGKAGGSFVGVCLWGPTRRKERYDCNNHCGLWLGRKKRKECGKRKKKRGVGGTMA